MTWQKISVQLRLGIGSRYAQSTEYQKLSSRVEWVQTLCVWLPIS